MITVTNTKQLNVKVMWREPGKMYGGTDADPLPNCEEVVLAPGQSVTINALNDAYDMVELDPTGNTIAGDGTVPPNNVPDPTNTGGTGDTIAGDPGAVGA